jgi:hypothetical protein
MSYKVFIHHSRLTLHNYGYLILLLITLINCDGVTKVSFLDEGSFLSQKDLPTMDTPNIIAFVAFPIVLVM